MDRYIFLCLSGIFLNQALASLCMDAYAGKVIEQHVILLPIEEIYNDVAVGRVVKLNETVIKN